MALSKATVSLLWRAVAFLGLFVSISGIVGSRIIGGEILDRDGFTIYGGLGKAAIFGLVAFLLLLKKDRLRPLSPWKPQHLLWLGLFLVSGLLSWVSVNDLIAGARNVGMIATAHASLILATVFAALASFGPDNLRLLGKAHKRELVWSAVIAAAFYVFLTFVYSLWLPLASIVLTFVHLLLGATQVPVDVIPPNILLTDKFGITIAEYCSGIESIALFSGLYIIVGLLERARLNFTRYLTLFPFALLLLFGLNIVRVYGLIAAGYYYDPGIAFSLFHSYAGLVFFIAYSAAFWGVAYKYILKKPSDPSGGSALPVTPRSIVISHVYSSDNKGDAALTSVLISDLKRKYPDARLMILRLESVEKNSIFEGVPEKPSFMYYALNRYKNPIAKLVYTIFMISATFAWAGWHRLTGKQLSLPRHLREVVQIYQEADLVVPVGGGYLRSRKGLFNRLNVPLLIHPLLFGAILKKPTVLYSQSIGPFQNRLEEWMIGFTLKRMTLLLIREDTTMKLLERLNVTNAVRAIDSGFLLKGVGDGSIRKRYNLPKQKLLIGVTVRSWLEGEAQKAYEQAVGMALDTAIQKYSAHVIFIPQVTATKGDDDRIASRRVVGYMQQNQHVTVVEDTPDHHEIKSIYDELDVLVGTRFHSVIFSLTSFVPVVAIEYEHKTSGILRDLGLGEWMVKIEETTEKRLGSLLDKAIKNHKAYKKQLQKNLPPYQREAERTVDLLADAYERAIQSPNS